MGRGDSHLFILESEHANFMHVTYGMTLILPRGLAVSEQPMLPDNILWRRPDLADLPAQLGSLGCKSDMLPWILVAHQQKPSSHLL